MRVLETASDPGARRHVASRWPCSDRGLRRANTVVLPGRLFHGPEWLVLGVNNVCNLHCRMCDVGQAETETNFASNLLGASPRDMPMELMERIVDQTATHFPAARLGFAFTEPLHLSPPRRGGRARRLPWAVVCGDHQRTDPRSSSAEELAAAGLDDLFLSLDGPPGIHDEIRGREGSFDRAMTGVEALLAARAPTAGLDLLRHHGRGISGISFRFSSCSRRLPLHQVGFMHPNFTTEDGGPGPQRALWRSLPRHHLEPRSLRSRPRWICPSSRAELAIIDRSAVAVSGEFFAHARAATRRSIVSTTGRCELIGRSCGDAFRALMIKSDGRVIPAHGRCYDVTVGNLHRNESARDLELCGDRPLPKDPQPRRWPPAGLFALLQRVLTR